WMEQLRIHETGPSSFQINSAERRLWEQIDKMTMEDPVPATNIAWFKRPVQIAAILLLLVSVIWLAGVLLQPSIKEYTTAFGEVNRFQLPDGSFVTLNGNSSLKFQNAGLFGNSRKSWLEGEGFFEIQSTSDKQP